MASFPPPGDNHQSTGGRFEKTQCQAKWPREIRSVTYVPGLSTLSDLSRIVAHPPPSFLCFLRPPSHHPLSLTSVSLARVSHWLRALTPFWQYGTHLFFPHAQTISALSDLLYSLTPYSSYPTHLFISNSIHRDTPTKLLKHFISRTFTFPLSALLIPHASAPYNAVGTITPSYGHFLAFIPNPLLLRTLFSAAQALYPTFILCTTSLTHPPSLPLATRVLKIIHFL